MNRNDLNNTSGTNWEVLAAMSDDNINYSDIPPLTDEFFERATLRIPAAQAQNLEHLDPDVMKWFQSQDVQPTEMINPVLRRYTVARSRSVLQRRSKPIYNNFEDNILVNSMLNFRRQLGLVEHLFATFHEMGAMIYVNIARIKGIVTGDLLRTAIDLLQQRHPLLQVHLEESDGSFYFCTESTLPIPLSIIDRQNDRQWTEIAEDELSRKFTGEFEPLCRITLLQSSDRLDSQELIVTFHHAIADGLSALHFMHELISVYQQLVAGIPVLPMESLPLLPPLELLLAQYLSEPAANLTQVPPSQTNPPPALLIEQAAPVDRRQTRLLPYEFDRDLTLQLKNRCREERTTVHGALCAAMLLVSMRQLSSPEPVMMSCGSNVNLRGSCLPLVERDHLGCFVSVVTTSHQISIDANFWELARECQATIHQLIDDKFPHYQVSNPDLISRYQPSFLAQLAEHNLGRTTTAHVSNLGQFDFTKSSESVRLESFYFATGQNLVGTCFWLGAVTIDRRLFCTFTYVDPLISPNTAKSLVNSTITILTNAAAAPLI